MSDAAKPTVNEYLREKRIESGLSQRKLAKKAGLCINTIGNIERNCSFPDFKTIAKISIALNIDMNDLVNRCEL